MTMEKQPWSLNEDVSPIENGEFPNVMLGF